MTPGPGHRCGIRGCVWTLEEYCANPICHTALCGAHIAATVTPADNLYQIYLCHSCLDALKSGSLALFPSSHIVSDLEEARARAKAKAARAPARS